ncbi:MAG: hypothetical protein ABI969_16885 [bacterium]
MDDVQAFAVVSVIIVGLVGSLAMIAVATVRLLNKPRSTPAPLDGRSEQQLEQLQQSIDAIAIEVERIAEAQRFSARLMSERSERASLPS